MQAASFGHMLRALYAHPWAIAESALHGIVEALSLASTGQISRDELEQMLAVRAPRPNPTRTASVAVIPVHGVITQGQGLFSFLFGGTSVDQIGADFKAAMLDRQTDAIVLDVNSPGGTIGG